MFNCAKVVILIASLATYGAYADSSMSGSWVERRKTGDEEYLYEVTIVQHNQAMIGKWLVEAPRSSAACLSGTVQRGTALIKTCTIDGSVGSRDMKAVCPEYSADRNRFVLKGEKLAWETWNSQAKSWNQFALLERVNTSRSPVSQSDEICGWSAK